MANFLEKFVSFKRRRVGRSKYGRFDEDLGDGKLEEDSEAAYGVDNLNNHVSEDDNAGGVDNKSRQSGSNKRVISSIEVDYERYESELLATTTASSSTSEEVDSRYSTNGEQQPIGSLNLLSQKYESLDYDLCENRLFLEEQKNAGLYTYYLNEILRWIIIFFIGLLTALTACIIVYLVEILSKYKYTLLQDWVDKCASNKKTQSSTSCMMIPFGLWLVMNAIPVAIGSAIVTYIAPVAAGSGIPVIKCYLNGVKIPEVVRIKTYLAKLFGVVLSVVGGLACGKEGPMIHCGAVIAAGISQGKSTSFKKDAKLFQAFRDDREKRDFVSAGAAAGVSAAFGAPVGGVLFSLEEGASFWNQQLTWRIFFCSMITTFTLNLILSTYHQHPGQLSYAGLLNFGKFNDQDFNYNFVELPLYMLMGAVGGIFGAFFNYINYKLTVFRMRYLYKRWIKVLEATVVAMMTATIGFLMILYVSDCFDKNENQVTYPIQYNCNEGDYSVMGALWFNTPEATLRNLFHNVKGTWSPVSLSIFFVVYFFLACWTYGLSVSSGLFIPSLLVGAAWGRLIAIFIDYMFPDQAWVCPGKFALIGAAASLGGVVRMTISLTVIMIEATGNITFGLPIMITLMVAKCVGDLFTEGLYDIHIQLSSVPFLNWEPPILSSTVYASEVMSTPVTTFKTTENVGRIIDVLINEPHNGFPVVDADNIPDTSQVGDGMQESGSTHQINTPKNIRTFGRFRGLILRWQLIVMLQERMFDELKDDDEMKDCNLQTFRNAYPRYPDAESVIPIISLEERNRTIDLRPVMNPSAYSVQHTASLPRIFRLFRALGLRHLVVINDRNEVIGIATRKDIARYRAHWKRGKPSIQELQISRG